MRTLKNKLPRMIILGGLMLCAVALVYPNPWVLRMRDSSGSTGVGFSVDRTNIIIASIGIWMTIVGIGITVFVGLSANRTVKEIERFLRSGLTDINGIYTEVHKMLSEIGNDEDSVFLLASSGPFLCMENIEIGKNKIYLQLHGRFSENRKTVLVFLDSVGGRRSALFKFYERLGAFAQRHGGGRIPAGEMYDKTIMKVQEFHKAGPLERGLNRTFMKMVESIPYQVFIRCRSTGEKKGVFFFTGREAIEKNMPVAGFVTEHNETIGILENAFLQTLGETKITLEDLYRGDYGPLVHTRRCIFGRAVLGLDRTRYPDEASSIELQIEPGVFCPAPAGGGCSANVLTSYMKDHPAEVTGKRVLDMGCGSGAQSIFAAMNGATKVMGVDIFPAAVACSNKNVVEMGVMSTVVVMESDLFKKIHGTDKFDLILADLPFVDGKPRNMQERAFLDEDHQTLCTFLRQAPAFLEAGGKILVTFSSLSEKTFDQLIEKANVGDTYDVGECFMEEHEGISWYVYPLPLHQAGGGGP